jgi:hypothetical protein
MSDFVSNKKYKILSENDEFVEFDGLYKSSSTDLYEYNGVKYTGDHRIKIDDEWINITDLPGVKMIDGEETVFDVINVDKYNSYISNNLIHHNCLVLDEFAFVDRGAKSNLAEEFVSSVFPTISSAKVKKNSKIIIISTPNGMNMFFRIWKKALAGINDFIPFKIDWKDVPRATDQETFKQNQINTIGQIAWEQEDECVDGDTQITLKDKDTGETKTLTIAEVEKLLNDLTNK